MDQGEKNLQTQGIEVARAFHVTLRTIGTHGWTNEASVGAVEGLTRVVNEAFDAQGEFGLFIVGENVYLNETRLRLDARGFAVINHLIQDLNKRGMGSIQFQRAVGAQDLKVLFEKLLQVNEEEVLENAEESLAGFNQALEDHALPIAVGPVRDEDLSLEDSDTMDEDRKERAKRSFFKAVAVSKALLTSSHLNKRLNLKHAKRVVQNMVDVMLEEEFSMMGLTTLKDYDNYTFYHSVNVCIFSLALGKKLELDRNQLSELGVAALMHDMGKTKIPMEILQKAGKLDKAEIEVIRHHPEMGVRELLKMKGLSSLAFKSMVAAFEHHLNFDEKLAGYPEVRKPFKPHVIGRIVAIADCFDAMTTKRCYTSKAMTRDKALAFMLNQGGKKFDPVMVRVFANLVGVFPVGTTVRLTSGRIAIVTIPAEDKTLCHRPTVKPITTPDGIEGEFPEIDLALQSESGNPDEIICAVDESTLGFDTARYVA